MHCHPQRFLCPVLGYQRPGSIQRCQPLFPLHSKQTTFSQNIILHFVPLYHIKFFFYYFLNVHLHNFQRKKVIKKSENSRNQSFSSCFCLMIEGSRSGSVSLTNGSGSGSSKNIWILRIRISNTAQNRSTESQRLMHQCINALFCSTVAQLSEKKDYRKIIHTVRLRQRRKGP